MLIKWKIDPENFYQINYSNSWIVLKNDKELNFYSTLNKRKEYLRGKCMM